MEHVSDPWDEDVSVGDLVRQDIWSMRRASLSRLFPDVRGWRVLEAGSGPGHDSLYFAEHGAQVTLVDFSRRGLSAANRIYSDMRLSVQTVQADALSLPFRDGTFDLVFNAGVLEHFEDEPLQTIMSEMARVSRPGGWVLAFCPNRYNVFYQTLLRRTRKHQYEFERAFTAGELTEQFAAVGVRSMYRSGVHVHPAINYVLPGWLPKHHRLEPWMRRCFAWLERSDRFNRIKSLIGQDFVVWGQTPEK